ncbi:MAG: 2-phospho-L-lactate guanylyltransferase [Solirubrobacteraceae bacterium]
MRTAAVLPVKSFGRAKQRLDAAVGQPDRGELAAAMVRDVLAVLRVVPGLDDVLVVTAEPQAAAAARDAGARVVEDPVEAGQSDAASRGVRAALDRGFERALLVPGDCPALNADEVAALLVRFGGAGVVIVPDRHGSGTNALLLTPPDAIVPSFGPGSFARHALRGAAAGSRVRVAQAPSLELDVDTPGDLAALRAALATLPDAAPQTRALLKRLAPSSALA